LRVLERAQGIDVRCGDTSQAEGNAFHRVEVSGGNMLAGNMQEIVAGLAPGDRVVSNALVLQSTVEQ